MPEPDFAAPPAGGQLETRQRVDCDPVGRDAADVAKRDRRAGARQQGLEPLAQRLKVCVLESAAEGEGDRLARSGDHRKKGPLDPRELIANRRGRSRQGGADLRRTFV